MSTFLSNEDVAALTGRKVKSKQIEALRRMGLPFFVNAAGRAVVTRLAVEGKTDSQKTEKKAWVPPGLRA